MGGMSRRILGEPLRKGKGNSCSVKTSGKHQPQMIKWGWQFHVSSLPLPTWISKNISLTWKTTRSWRSSMCTAHHPWQGTFTCSSFHCAAATAHTKPQPPESSSHRGARPLLSIKQQQVHRYRLHPQGRERPRQTVFHSRPLRGSQCTMTSTPTVVHPPSRGT